MNTGYKLIFTGGGSGGHTMPAFSMIQSLIEHCDKINRDLSILYIGSETGIEREIAQKHGINYKFISTGKLRRYLSFKNFTDIFRIVKGLFDSIKIIKDFKPNVLISTGGFVSVPPVIASFLMFVPVIIHEQTIDAGLANKIAGAFADKIALTFSESIKYFNKKKTIVTGIPLRKEIFTGNRKNAFNRFGLDKKLPVIYITGGGLGCHILNIAASKIMPKILQRANVIFQTGKSNENQDYNDLIKLKSVLPKTLQKRLLVFDFIHNEIGDIYSIADLAISRSGAGTVNELMYLGIPAIFIPLPFATKNEQYRNAKVAVDINSAVILEEKNLTPDSLMQTINDILFTGKYKIMKKNLHAYQRLDGTKNMLELIMTKIVEK